MIRGMQVAARDVNPRLQSIGDQLDALGSIDFANGSIQINEGDVRDVWVGALGDDEGGIYADAFIAMTRDGYAVLEPPQDEVPGVAFPWRLLVQTPMTIPDLLTPSLLAEFGIGSSYAPATARAVMEDRFGNVPASVLDPVNLEQLSQAALFATLRSPAAKAIDELRELDEKLKIKVKPATRGSQVHTGEKTVDDFANAVVCISDVEITAHWWGLDLCWDQRCADLIGKALVAGGGAVLSAALGAFLKNFKPSVGIKTAGGAAIAAVGGAVVFVLAVIGVYTGVSLLLNNTPRGCCLQIPWPVTGGVIWWAKGR